MTQSELEKYGYEFVFNKYMWYVRYPVHGPVFVSGRTAKNKHHAAVPEAIEKATIDFVRRRIHNELIQKRPTIIEYTKLSDAAMRMWADELYLDLIKTPFMKKFVK